MAIAGKRLQLTLAVTGAIAWVLQEYDQALMNGLLTLPSFIDTFPAIDTSTPRLADKNSTLQGTAVALYEVGAAIGALTMFFIGDWYGRKRPAMGAAVVVLIGVILQATSFGLAQLIVARIVTGLGVGSLTATIPSWVGESADANHRGRLVMLEGSGAIFGVMFVGWLELGFYFVPHNSAQEVSWRFPIAFQAVFPLTVLCIAPFLAESPRWLLSKDRHIEGRQVLARLENEPEDSELVSARVQIIIRSLHADSQGQSKNPFGRTTNRHLNRTLLAVGINILAQMSGVNVITFYSNTIFQHTLGYDAVLSRVISGCMQTWQFVAATSAIFLVDRFGRRKLLLVGACFMVIANAGITGTESHVAGNPTIAGISILFYFIALAAFPIGLFLVPFMYASEIAPLRIRAQVTAMSASANWIFNFLVAEVSPVAFANISWKYYIVYICTNSLTVLVVYLFLPETKGRSLEDIDACFISSTNALQPRKVAKTMHAGIAEELMATEKVGDYAEQVEKAM
ncbi:general substrate transporter [Hortaea werneckii]|uniref:Major facilitator superfamily (MFS) profile domain-containing protein n=1 Tax=Hortaea werneckii TaxID=91943 RepID=A0A3M7IRW9_HORWE|nr:general substrate transporter [Hortaea werneckii]KAI6852434.1 general substrate transporter [Hortaea werneckii]KAI6923327.1 general substrate transporter [Hortaea werneckii]KAI6947559.1 general substrate transporter [Hortaea werneckii]KAI6959468.1 general substrate transporter [Hortaea werneckii]